MTTLFFWILLSLSVSGALVVAMGFAYNAPSFERFRISKSAPMRLPWSHRLRMMATTTVLSLSIVLGVPYLLFGLLFTEDAGVSWLVIAAQVVGIVLLYDFVYYAAHRAMHHPKVLRYVHGIHHRARNPSTFESFYQHPAELVVGLAILFGSTLAVSLVSPVHVVAFGITFFLYSTLNVLVHSGLVFGSVLTWPIDFLTKKHFKHHMSDPEKNFSTLTALPDILFRTVV